MRATDRERSDIQEYVEREGHEEVTHLEKVASELVGPVRHDIWDVHCTASRWWVVTNPTNLYDQADFKSCDVALTFHIGLTLRVSYLEEREIPLTPDSADLLPGSWRRWQQAFDALDGQEAEVFQAVGVRLRECLISVIAETRSDHLVPDGQAPPKGANFKAWSELLANNLAAGASVASLRSYLKKMAVETWEYVNWLTHAKNATRMDAEIGLKAVEHLLGVFTAARLRGSSGVARCESCGSYELVGGECEHCDWVDPTYVPPRPREITQEEWARRLATPCMPSTDISTFMRPEDVLRPQRPEGHA